MDPIAKLLSQGKIDQARAQAIEAVRAEPAVPGPRIVLAEVHLVAGDLERAAKQVEGLAGVCEPAERPHVEAMSGLVRAEQRRREVFAGRASPDIVVCGSDALSRRSEAWKLAAQGRAADAKRQVTAIDADRAERPGSWDGEPFEDFRDLDDLCASLLEVHLVDGRYGWVDWSKVARVEFLAPANQMDIMWRWADLELWGEAARARVVVPMIYAATIKSGQPEHLAGRCAGWIERDGLGVGVGHRRFMTDRGERLVDRAVSLAFATPVDPKGSAA